MKHRHADLAPQILLVILITVAVALKWVALADVSTATATDPKHSRHDSLEAAN